ncbi:copper ion chaperone, partial [Auriculariales sp. MPI-PUGE-AT-0066]
AQHQYQFNVKMTCSGCSGAVTRALSKAEGIESYEVNLEKQEVTVNTDQTYEYVHEKIAKTGKEVSLSVFRSHSSTTLMTIDR